MSPIRLVIAGISGRMGRDVLSAAQADPAFTVVGGTFRRGAAPPEMPGDLRLVDNPAAIVLDADAVIDFTTPTATLAHAAVCAEHGVALVCGTTGFAAGEMSRLRTHGAEMPLYLARNMSVGVGALLALLPTLVAALTGHDVEIVETHHRHKRDVPSGTALALAEAIVAGDVERQFVHGRAGTTPRTEGEIGIHAIRGGGNPGEHTIIFASDGEEVRISHRAFSRRAYAEGSLRAAAWLVRQPPGMYGPGDLRQHVAAL